MLLMNGGCCWFWGCYASIGVDAGHSPVTVVGLANAGVGLMRRQGSG